MSDRTIDGIDLEVVSYWIKGETVMIEKILSRGVWAVRDGGLCLTKTGVWAFEPMPSSRTKSFLKKTRFYTLEDAVAAYKKRRQEK